MHDRRASSLGLLMLLMSTTVIAGSIQRATARLPDAPPPPQTRMEWIARSMRLNGLPMTLRSFKSSMSVADVFAYYEQWWASASLDVQRSAQQLRLGSWQVLALTSPRIHITVRAQSSGSGATGTVAISSNPALVQTSLATSFPYPRDAHVTSLQQYEDPGSTAESIGFASARSIDIAARDFSRALTLQGWNVYRDVPGESGTARRVLEAQKGAEVAQLTFAPADHGGSRVAVIWRRE